MKVQLLACRKVVIKMVSWCVSKEWIMVKKKTAAARGERTIK